MQTPVHATAPEVMNVLPGAQRAGSARLSVWGFDVYDATLYVAPGFRADAWAQSRLALELHYLRGFDGDDIAERSLEEMRRAGPIAAPQANRWLSEMKQAFPDVKKGDRLLGVYRPDEGVLFFHNGKPTRPACATRRSRSASSASGSGRRRRSRRCARPCWPPPRRHRAEALAPPCRPHR